MNTEKCRMYVVDVLLHWIYDPCEFWTLNLFAIILQNSAHKVTLDYFTPQIYLKQKTIFKNLTANTLLISEV